MIGMMHHKQDLNKLAFVIHTTSTSSTWSPLVITNSGATLHWEVTGDASGSYDADDPTIDLSGNTGTAIITVTSADDLVGLTYAVITSLNITYLDLSACVSLFSLFAQNNNISDIIFNENLSVFSVANNNLSSLDLSVLLSPTSITCTDNTITNLDVSNFTSLNTLNCYKNTMTSLNVSNCTSLSILNCYENNLTSIIGFTDLVGLTSLNCNKNFSLASLDISNSTLLHTIIGSNMALTTIDISSNTALKSILLSRNHLTVSAINNIILDRYNNGLLSGTRQLQYNVQTPTADPTATEYIANDVLDAYNALVAGGWSITGTAPS